MSEIAIDAVEYLDRLWTDSGSVVCGYWSDFCSACVIGGPAKVQRDAQAAILMVNQGHPSCTRPTFAGANMRHDHSDMPALGPATAPLASIPILLQQRRLVGCFTYPSVTTLSCGCLPMRLTFRRPPPRGSCDRMKFERNSSVFCPSATS